LDPEDTGISSHATSNVNGKPADLDNHTTIDIDIIELRDTQLQENPLDGCTFLSMAAGTLMLVPGMMVCGHVVEVSALE
jgi:hypothetical protein